MPDVLPTAESGWPPAPNDRAGVVPGSAPGSWTITYYSGACSGGARLNRSDTGGPGTTVRLTPTPCEGDAASSRVVRTVELRRTDPGVAVDVSLGWAPEPAGSDAAGSGGPGRW